VEWFEGIEEPVNAHQEVAQQFEPFSSDLDGLAPKKARKSGTAAGNQSENIADMFTAGMVAPIEDAMDLDEPPPPVPVEPSVAVPAPTSGKKTRAKVLLLSFSLTLTPVPSQRAASIATAAALRLPKTAPTQFWNAQVQALSDDLWQPTFDALEECKDDLPALVSNGERTGWCAVNQLKRKATLPPLQPVECRVEAPPARKVKSSFWDKAPDAAGEGGEAIEATVLVVHKFKLVTTPELRVILKQWFGASRWVYNHAIAHIKKNHGQRSLEVLRKLFVNNEAFKTENKWMTAIPNAIRDAALRDADKAYGAELKKKKANPQCEFNMKFRSKRDPSQSIELPHRVFMNGTMFPRFHRSSSCSSPDSVFFRRSKLGPLKFRPPLDFSLLHHDCRLQRTAVGDYYLCVPFDVPAAKEGENQAQIRIASGDPGVRTFLTFFTSDGKIIEIAPGSVGRIASLCMHLDKLQSKIDDKGKFKARNRLRMRKAAARLRQRIRNLVNDVHKKAASFLARNFDVVVLPEFESSQMVKRAKRRINTKTARMMLTWAHYRFRQTLLARARQSGTRVVLVSEAYTSKTCGKCGVVHAKLGGRKLFYCPTCRHRVDRDFNAARNILLRNAQHVQLRVQPRPTREGLSLAGMTALPPGASSQE
jgi:putative transposase